MRPPGTHDGGKSPADLPVRSDASASILGRVRDSLPTRVLFLVLLINLVVYGAGGVYVWRVQAERLTHEVLNALKSNLIREEGPTLDYLLRSPVWSNFADSILVDKNLEVQGDNIVAKGIDLNPSGVGSRAVDFDRRQVLSALHEAIVENRDVPAINGGSVMAIPDPLGTDNWGGLWYRIETEPDPLRLLLSMLPWFAVSTMLLTAGSFFALKRLVLDPVGQLAVAARHVREGDFSYQLPEPVRRDELADLVRSFNSMTAKVSSFNHILSEEVRVATQKARAAEAAAMRQRRLAAMGELAAGIAHEINNPLGGLQNAVATLEKGGLSEERRTNYFGLLSKGLDRIGETVARLRRFTPRDTPMAEVDLCGTVYDAIALVRHRAESTGCTIAWEAPTARLPIVLGSRTEIGQALLNLLVNALDALEENGTKDQGGMRIDVALEAASNGVLLSVRDNGMGVSEQELERAPDLFFSTKEVGKGSGLGLAIVHNTLEQHGGRVRLASEEGRFFEVGLWFPASQPGSGEFVS